MGQILDVEPVDYYEEGTTNAPEVTWVRSGDVVTVTVFSYSISSTQVITGLPKPANTYILSGLYTATALQGQLQFYNDSWTIIPLSGTPTLFGSFTYVCQH